jgi:putative ABC transport system permease protein
MGQLGQDVQYGLRMIRRNPGFAIVAICTLALGIGANSAIFSIVNTALLRQLPFRNPDRLVALQDQYSRPEGTEQLPVALPNFLDWRSSNRVFEEMGVEYTKNANVMAAGEPTLVPVGYVSDGFFPLLDVQPMLGRTFTKDECLPTGARVAVLSHAYWQQQLGGRIDAVGQSISIDREPHTVVGVMPPDFKLDHKGEFLQDSLWVPIPPWLIRMSHRGNHMFTAVARLKPGVSLTQAQAAMSVIAASVEKQYPDNCTGLRTLVQLLHESLSGHLRPTVLPLLAAVGFVLLIACANVANLLMARASTREKELAIRSALGAGRMRVVRQLLTESLLLALMGGALGLLVAFWGCSSINGFLVETGLQVPPSSIDGRVLAFAFLVSLLTGVLFGLIPALESSRVNLNHALKEAGRTASSGSSHHRFKSLLVILEVALSLVLLVGAGLLIKSFLRLWLTNPGFSKEKVLTMTVPLSGVKYPDRIELVRQLLERVASLPGVQSAASTSNLPTQGGLEWYFDIEGRPASKPGQEPRSIVQFVSPRFFQALGIAMKQGRGFTEQDTAKSLPVVVVNESMARKYWGDQNTLGERIKINNISFTIVGIVSDVRQDGLAIEPQPHFYISYFQGPQGEVHLAIRTATEPLSLANAVRQQVRALDSTLAMADIRTLEMVLSRNVSRQRLVMSLMAVFAALALLLAMIGIYGVVAYSVSQRQQEIGIRMALGAKAGDILKMVLRQGMMLTLIGLVLGGVGAFALTRWLSSELFGVSPTDPLIFVGVATLMVLVSFLACLLPARRAAHLDPLVAVKYE